MKHSRTHSVIIVIFWIIVGVALGVAIHPWPAAVVITKPGFTEDQCNARAFEKLSDIVKIIRDMDEYNR